MTIALLAVLFAIAGVLLPIAVVGIPAGGAAVTLWEAWPYRIMLVVFIVLVILPLLFRRHDAWVPSLVGATVVLTLAFEHLLHSTIGQNSALVPFTLVLLVCAGVSLAAEAVFARHMWEMAR